MHTKIIVSVVLGVLLGAVAAIAVFPEAREKFLAAARIAGAATVRYDNPTKGPKGESLSTDVARLGPDDLEVHHWLCHVAS